MDFDFFYAFHCIWINPHTSNLRFHPIWGGFFTFIHKKYVSDFYLSDYFLYHFHLRVDVSSFFIDFINFHFHFSTCSFPCVSLLPLYDYMDVYHFQQFYEHRRTEMNFLGWYLISPIWECLLPVTCIVKKILLRVTNNCGDGRLWGSIFE